MKALVFVTYTDCYNKWRSLEAVGHEVHTVQYDDRPHDRHGELVDAARAIAPDFMVFIGAIEKYHHRPVPTSDVLCRLREVAPFIHMCNDASDKPWWPMIEEYHARECFTLQVSIDGNPVTPITGYGDRGMLMLTPADHRSYRPRPWAERDVRMGMVGGLGHTRRQMIICDLRARGALTFFEGPNGRTYEEMADTMGRFKTTFNCPMNGTGDGVHVKGRVVEAGLAGACLLEEVGAPTNIWFEPGVDYLEYRDGDDVMRLLEETPDAKLEEISARFHKRVVEEHHPRVFWDKVLAKANVHAR